MDNILIKSKQERLYDVNNQVKKIIKGKFDTCIENLVKLSNVLSVESDYDLNNMEDLLEHHHKITNFSKYAILKTNGEILGNGTKKLKENNNGK